MRGFVGVHGDVGTSRLFVHEEHLLPRRTTIRGAVDAALGLRRIQMPRRAGNGNVRIRRAHDEPSDTARSLEPDMSPRLARIGRTVHAVSHRKRGAYDKGLAGTRPDDVGIGRRNSNRADRSDVDIIEDRRPARAAIGRLPDTAGSGADINDRVIPWLASNGDRAVTVRSDVAIGELREKFGV